MTKDRHKTKSQLLDEVRQLRKKVDELESSKKKQENKSEEQFRKNVENIKNKNGKPIGRMASFVDITEQKKAELKRDQYQKLLNSTLYAVDSLLFVIDKNHRIILSNWNDHEWVPEEERDKMPYCYK
ncbi:MAG: hypothetical protein ACOC7U_06130, partial [Spirochaetota bacterium]